MESVPIFSKRQILTVHFLLYGFVVVVVVFYFIFEHVPWAFGEEVVMYNFIVSLLWLGS